MTYKYYHEVIKGKAPKNAPTYQAPEKITDKETWACQICGYIYEGDLTKEQKILFAQFVNNQNLCLKNNKINW